MKHFWWLLIVGGFVCFTLVVLAFVFGHHSGPFVVDQHDDCPSLSGSSEIARRDRKRRSRLNSRIANTQCDQWRAKLDDVADDFLKWQTVSTRRPFAMFTSAGNFNNVKSWLADDGPNKSNRQWDLIVNSYENCTDSSIPSELQLMSDVFSCSPGSKYGSLDAMYHANHSLVRSYLCVGVLDDDAHAADIDKLNKLCEIVVRERLILLSPAITGHAHYVENRPVANSSLRHTIGFDMTYNVWNAQWLEYYLSMRENRLVSSHEQYYIKSLLGFGKNNHNECVDSFFAVSDQVVLNNPVARSDGVREMVRHDTPDVRERRQQVRCFMEELQACCGFRRDI